SPRYRYSVSGAANAETSMNTLNAIAIAPARRCNALPAFDLNQYPNSPAAASPANAVRAFARYRHSAKSARSAIRTGQVNPPSLRRVNTVMMTAIPISAAAYRGWPPGHVKRRASSGDAVTQSLWKRSPTTHNIARQTTVRRSVLRMIERPTLGSTLTIAEVSVERRTIAISSNEKPSVTVWASDHAVESRARADSASKRPSGRRPKPLRLSDQMLDAPIAP